MHSRESNLQPASQPASLPGNTGAESSAASSSSNPVKLATQHNWATQAETQTQSTSAADHPTTSPAGQQCVDTPSTSRTAAEAPPPEAGPDVQEETFFPRRHGRHDLRDERELYRSVTSESLDSREFSRIFLKIHFSISILSHLIFTFTSRKE